jgi:hypothetical protein
MRPVQSAVAAAVVAVAGLSSAPALAHHGWAWVDESKVFVLTGTVASIYLGNPHAQLQVKNAEGTWIVDLAPLVQATRAGFVKGVTNVGDPITLVGHRARSADLAMKAKQVRVGDRIFNVYPNDYPATVAS